MKIALVSTMILPVPAVRGGAVELLTTFIVEENEKNKLLDIDLYTIYDKQIENISYQNTNIIKVKRNMLGTVKQKTINLFYRLTKQRKSFNSQWNKVANLISKKEYDVIVVENNMFVYKLIQGKTKDNLIYHMHNDFNDFDKTIKNCELIAKTSDKIIAVSQYIKNSIKEKVDTENVEVLLNAIDTEIFNKNNVKKLRDKYGINDNDMVIGYVGRITPEKGILELIQAFKEIKTNKNSKLLINGSQWYGNLEKDEYMTKIVNESEEIKDKIIYTGYLKTEEMPSIYSMLDIIVIPSLCKEGFGCVAIEAMAMGVPIISTKSGGLSEIVKENFGYSIVADENLVNKIKEKLEELIENDDKRKKYGENAQKEFKQNVNYHKEQYYNNFVDIIKK